MKEVISNKLVLHDCFNVESLKRTKAKNVSNNSENKLDIHTNTVKTVMILNVRNKITIGAKNKRESCPE